MSGVLFFPKSIQETARPPRSLHTILMSVRDEFVELWKGGIKPTAPETPHTN
jgi:hypothetical protein